MEVLQEIRHQTQALADYTLKISAETESNVGKVKMEIGLIKTEIATVYDKFEKQYKVSVEAITESVETLTGAVKNVQLTQVNQKDLIDCNISEISKTAGLVKELQSDHSSMQETLTDMQGEISDIKQNLTETYMSYSKPSGKVFFYPPDRLKHFMGREDEIQQLFNEFAKYNHEQRTQVICGLGGCGKTTVSVEFAWRYQQYYPGGIFWMSAESNATLDDSVTKLAIDINTDGKNSLETLNRTLKWLSRLKERWLLVVDNVDGEDIHGNVEELILGTWKRESQGHFIITSRREPTEVEESMNINSQNCVIIKEFKNEEGVIFMKMRSGNSTQDDDKQILTLVAELGGLPLALEQAAAHIKILKCTFLEYFERFRKKRLSLLKALKSSLTNNKERLTIRTTWQLNIDYIRKQSENEGLGTAAVTVMQISSFLYADDIPVQLINAGLPNIQDDDISDVFQDSLGAKQVIEILTRFSLFQRNGQDSLSVHRLVQEVIRTLVVVDQKRTSFVLGSAVKMIHKALKSTTSPFQTLSKVGRISRGSLQLWSKLAVNANALKIHLLKIRRDKIIDNNFYMNIETSKLLQTSAIYNSIHQRQDEALADQDQMLTILTTLDPSQEQYGDITDIKIPLLEKERTCIQQCIATVLQEEYESYNKTKTSIETSDAETLRLKGNVAFKEKRYYDAIQYYTEGMRAHFAENTDYRLFSNRSLSYLRINDYQNGLDDANTCIELAPLFWKGYCWKAYAIALLIKEGAVSASMEGVGLASACIAANLNKACLLEYRMKIYYPIILYKILNPTDDLSSVIESLMDRPFITLMLRRGLYILKDLSLTPKSLQVIGIGDNVQIRTGQVFSIKYLSNENFKTKFKRDSKLQIHFENVYFVSGGGQILVESKTVATFYRCKFSNGKKGCDLFPKCTGGQGCASPNPEKCKERAKICTGFANSVSGEPGSAGIAAYNGGIIYLEKCIFVRCGGGGILSHGDGSNIEITDCNICNVRQMGIEARHGGRIIAKKNVIVDNQFHGIAIGPRGTGIISANVIQSNGQEGIFCGGIVNSEYVYTNGPKTNPAGISNACIFDNIIRQNGLSGISLGGGSFIISGNKIFENWLWGLFIKCRSGTQILNNDIFENKCGGIRIGENYSSTVIIDGNTIRDHFGPDIYAMKSTGQIVQEIFERTGKSIALPTTDKIADEVTIYTKPPFVTNRNIRLNNNRMVQHPRAQMHLIRSCCYCHEAPQTLKDCSNCKKASYCSKECQAKHWTRHKHICKLLKESYVIEINIDKYHKDSAMNLRIFNPSLKGIMEGPSPNRKSSKRFIVKVQSGDEYGPYDPNKTLMLYDQSVSLGIQFSNPKLYHLIMECGILSATKLTTKKIFCWASFKQQGKVLCIHTENLPPFQTW